MCLAYPVQVISVDGALAVTDGPAALRQVPLVALAVSDQPIRPGDWLLVHSGLAVARLGAEEAMAQRRMLAELAHEGDAGNEH